MHDVESINHIFIHCPFATEIWERLLNEVGLSWVMPNRMDVFLASWRIEKVPKKGMVLWQLLVPVVC